jgi:serine/threonine-protein kinase RsbW
VSQSTVLTEITLNGNLDELQRLAAFVQQFCREQSLGDDVEFRLNLALEELFTNAVRHGGCMGPERAATIALTAVDDAVAIDYADRGAPFDPAGAPAPDLDAPLETRPAGGLGLHFVRQIAREFEYHRSGDWNRIAMRVSL